MVKQHKSNYSHNFSNLVCIMEGSCSLGIGEKKGKNMVYNNFNCKYCWNFGNNLFNI